MDNHESPAKFLRRYYAVLRARQYFHVFNISGKRLYLVCAGYVFVRNVFYLPLWPDRLTFQPSS